MTKQTQTIKKKKKFSKVNLEKKKPQQSPYTQKITNWKIGCEKKIPLTIATKKVKYLEKESNTKVHMKK